MNENLSAKYYQENRERLEKQPRERHQNLSNEEKKKSDYMVVAPKRYKNLLEDKDNILVDYKKLIAK